MAQINFTDFEKKKENRSFPERVKVGYFSSLKDDGDETLVRLNYNKKADFKVAYVHRITLDGKWRNVECLTGFYDTDEDNTCPLCASGDKRKAKVYVQLLEYSKNEQGTIVAEPKIWERGYGFVPELMDVIADAVEDEKIAADTPISDIVFKVRRVGAKGSMETKYKLKVMKPEIVPENVFTKDFSAFKDFDSAHHDYYSKTEEEIKYFLQNKKFPEVVKETKAESSESVEVKPAVEEPKITVSETKEESVPTAPTTGFNESKPAVNRYRW